MPKILIADDSIAVRKVAERLLTEAGLGVTLAANGEEALAYLAKERPDVVVSDVIMPDKSGYEVCAFVRGNATLSATPVLLISGIVNDEVTRQAESCHANGVLKKPFQGTSLKDRVLELIAKRQEPAGAAVAEPVSVLAAAPAERMMPMSDQLQQSLCRVSGKPEEFEEQFQAERVRSEELTRQLAESTAQLASAKETEAQLVTERKRADDLRESLAKVEEQFQAERARSEELTRQLAESTAQLASAKETEAQLMTERKRADDLQESLAKVEQQLSRIPELESALKAEKDAVEAFKQEAVNWQKTSVRIAELESALHAERSAAEQLVQQLVELEQVSIKARDVETRLTNAEQQNGELHQNIRDLEVALSTERRKREETMGHLQELERVATRVQEMEGLLVAERDRNGILARQVVETEQAADSATKRLEEMARKLSEIAGLASQLGHGRG
ncbi:MAG: response regulator [Nitrospira sp.]|nr:response regulator [Nitrospira sp.]